MYHLAALSCINVVQKPYICTTNSIKNMTTVKAFIRTGKKEKEANIRFRISDGRKVQLFHKSELTVLPTLWDNKREQYKSKSIIRTDERIRLNTEISERKKLLLSIYSSYPNINSEELERLVDEKLHPDKYQIQKGDLFSIMKLYLQKKKLSEASDKYFHVLIRALQRY